jgi:hypothetical protein
VPATRALIRQAAAAGVVALALAGCSQIDSALTKQEAVVRFRPGTTLETLLQARHACSHVPNLVPLPASLHPGDPTAGDEVRYQASKATGHDLALLQTCLEKFPDVSGVAMQDTSGKGL